VGGTLGEVFSEPKPGTIYLNSDEPLSWRKPTIRYPGITDVSSVRSSEGFSANRLRNNTSSPDQATDLIVIIGSYTWRNSKYIVATLDSDEGQAFEQVKRNWRINLWSDKNPSDDKKGLGWNYAGTALNNNVRTYVAYAKKEALKVAKAYEVVAQHCDEQNHTEQAGMFRVIAGAFEAVYRHKIKLPKLTRKERRESDSLARYERIVPPSLARVFLNKLHSSGLFGDLVSISPKMFYRGPTI